MDQSGQYSSSGRHHNLFQAPQLPPPSQLLPEGSSSFSRSNTLPPIPNIPVNSRFPPVQPYPHNLALQSSSVLPPLPLPSSTQHPWPTLHRTSNSRDELHPSQQSLNLRNEPPVKRESGSSSQSLMHQHEQDQSSQSSLPQKETNEDAMSSTSDFVKKLYKMLEDQSFQHVVSWGPQGDCFVVKDMNEFTKSILPRMFKHSNFASFVRQLNKYDFHKVKNTDDNQFSEHSWTFRHPDFHADRRDALENIKRKVPTQRKASSVVASARPVSSTSPGPYPSSSSSSQAQVEALQSQVERLIQAQEEMTVHIRSLERNYQDVLVEMVSFQRNMAQQDGLMRNLIQYFCQVENTKVKPFNVSTNTNAPSDPSGGGGGPSVGPGTMSDQNPFLPTHVAQRMMGSYTESDVARETLAQLNEISRRAEAAGLSFTGREDLRSGGAETALGGLGELGAGLGLGLGLGLEAGGKAMSRQDALARIEELQRSRPTSTEGLQNLAGLGNLYTTARTGGADAGFELPRTGTESRDEDTVGPTDNSGNATGRWGETDTMGGSHQGLEVYTVGHLMPKSSVDNGDGSWAFDPNSLGVLGLGLGNFEGESDGLGAGPGSLAGYNTPDSSSLPSAPSFAESSSAAVLQPPRPESSQKLRVRRSAFVPGWAVPPRVLLVDDDAVSRKLSSKFLQVYGCTIDVAVDGVGAVNKMNLEKYDLVLMDIVMPKLDGVSATSLIRKFDHMTPIISMTSNSKPNEIMTYYSSGMNDILPKPFTKEGLFDMLEKHLTHLKVIQQMSRVPRSVGIPPLSDSSFEQALTSQAASVSNTNVTPGGTIRSGSGLGFGLGADDDGGRINPLAGMGLTDEQYAMILQNLVNGESFPAAGMGVGGGQKRAQEDSSDGRDGKRSRFEVVE